MMYMYTWQASSAADVRSDSSFIISREASNVINKKDTVVYLSQSRDIPRDSTNNDAAAAAAGGADGRGRLLNAN